VVAGLGLAADLLRVLRVRAVDDHGVDVAPGLAQLGAGHVDRVEHVLHTPGLVGSDHRGHGAAHVVGQAGVEVELGGDSVVGQQIALCGELAALLPLGAQRGVGFAQLLLKSGVGL